MRLQIFGQVMRGIALACSMTDHDDFSAGGHGIRNLFVIRRLFRRPLTPFPGLVLVDKMMQKVMGIVGSDHMLRSVSRRDIDMKNFRPVMIHNDQQTWRSRIRMGGRLRRQPGRDSGLHEEMPNIAHRGTRKILGVGFAHDVALAGDLKYKLAVGLLVGFANFPD